MTFPFRILASLGILLAWISTPVAPALAQTAVVIDARVVELPMDEMDQLRISDNPAFVRALSKKMAEYLLDESRAKTVHRIELPATAGSATQFRLDSRIAADSIGLGVEITPKVFQNRDIVLATSSQVRIRRDPDAEGKQKVIFENPPTKFETRIQEGVTIILGGFITAAERLLLPAVPELPDNAILRYLFGKTAHPEKSEIAVLLTPRVAGTLISAATDTVVSPPAVPAPAVNVKPPVTKEVPGVYTVQIGAFDKLEKAEMMVAQVMKKHDDVFIQKATSGPALKTPYRVRVGRLPDMRTAKQLQRQLAQEGLDTFITNLE